MFHYLRWWERWSDQGVWKKEKTKYLCVKNVIKEMKYRSWDHDCWRNWLWWWSRKSFKLHALLLTTSSWRSSSAYLRYVALDVFEISTCERGARSKARWMQEHISLHRHDCAVFMPIDDVQWVIPQHRLPTHWAWQHLGRWCWLSQRHLRTWSKNPQSVRGWVQSTSYQRKSTLRWSSTEHLAFPCRELLDGEKIESVDRVEAR